MEFLERQATVTLGKQTARRVKWRMVMKKLITIGIVFSFILVNLAQGAELDTAHPHVPYTPKFNSIQNMSGRTVTVLSLLEAGHVVKTGFVCASDKDIVCIDGLCNEEGKYYWSITVNGEYKYFNSQSLVGPLDRLEVRYIPSSDFVEER